MLSNRYVIKILIPLGLFLLWILLLAIQIFLIEKSFTLIAENYSHDIISAKNSRRIESNKFKAIFTATNDNLGIVSIHFDEGKKMLPGNLLFRIKKDSDKDWYYENRYNLEELNDLSFYPFGFPIYKNSKNKTFIIEIELAEPNKNKVLTLSKSRSTFTVLYKYPKEPLLQNRGAFVAFLFKKVLNNAHNNYQLFGSMICLYPFLFYLIWLLVKKRYINYLLISILLLTIFIDTLYIFQFFDMAYITIATIWLLIFRRKNDASKYSFEMSLVMVFLCLVFQLQNSPHIVEKSASWSFMFLFLGLIQGLRNIEQR